MPYTHGHTKEHIMEVIDRNAKYVKRRCGYHSNGESAYGWFFSFGDACEQLNCARGTLNKWIPKYKLHAWIEGIKKRERDKHIARENKRTYIKCNTCKKAKPRDKFYPDSRAMAGYRPMCMSCRYNQDLIYYPKEVKNAQARERWARFRDSPEYKKKSIEYQRQWKQDKPYNYARDLLKQQIRREYGVNISVKEIPHEMVLERMKAIDLYRKRHKLKHGK